MYILTIITKSIQNEELTLLYIMFPYNSHTFITFKMIL